MPYSAGWTTAILGYGADGAALESHEDVDGQRVVAVDPERRGVDDDIEAGGITEGTGFDGTGRRAHPKPIPGEVWVKQRG